MSIEETIRGIMAKKSAPVTIVEQVGADKVGDGPVNAPGQSEQDEPNVKRNNTNQSVIAKSNLKQGSVKGNATAPEGKFPSNFSAPGQTKEELEAEGTVVDAKDKEYTVDVSEDVAALMNGEDLSEEFKAKATTIFEAAVLSRVKTEVSKLEEAYENALQEQFEEIAEGLVEQVNGYLDVMVEKWLEDNALALESGLKNDILEGFVTGLQSLFKEHYIEVPEDKFDVVASLEEEVAELSTKLDESMAKTVELTQVVSSMKRSDLIAEAATGLADTEVEKFTNLAEELVFESAESYASKLKTIRESYFTKKSGAKSLTESVVTDAPVELEADAPVLTGSMAAYVRALDNVSK